MMPRARFAALKEKKWWEYLVRFLFGGALAASTGIVTHAWGPVVGGLFLGFPSILPASLTLVKRHDGRRQAVEDARGGRIGTVGLAAFAAAVWATAGHWPAVVVLAVAALCWAIVDFGLWSMRFGRTRP